MTSPEEFAAEFCGRIVERDFPAAEAMLAPWIRASLPAGGLRKLVRLALGDAPVPTEYDLEMLEDEEELAALPLPAEVNDDNLRGVFTLDFIPDEDAETDVEYSFGFLAAVVDFGSAPVIGYLESVE